MPSSNWAESVVGVVHLLENGTTFMDTGMGKTTDQLLLFFVGILYSAFHLLGQLFQWKLTLKEGRRIIYINYIRPPFLLTN